MAERGEAERRRHRIGGLGGMARSGTRARARHGDAGQGTCDADRDDGRGDLVPDRRLPELSDRARPRLLPHPPPDPPLLPRVIPIPIPIPISRVHPIPEVHSAVFTRRKASARVSVPSWNGSLPGVPARFPPMPAVPAAPAGSTAGRMAVIPAGNASEAWA